MALKFSSSSIKLQRQGPAAQSHTLVVTNTHNYPVAFKAFPTPNLTCSITPAIRKINAKSSVTVNIRICIKAEDAQFIRGALSFKSSLMPEQMNDVDQFWRALEGRDNGRSFADLLHTQNITISYADAAAANTIKLYPPDILDFSEDQTPTIMLVSNPSSRPVAIKIKVNNKAAYSVRHNVFRIEPEDTREVAIYRSTDPAALASTRAKDRLLVLSAAIPPERQSRVNDRRSIEDLMQTVDLQTQVVKFSVQNNVYANRASSLYSSDSSFTMFTGESAESGRFSIRNATSSPASPPRFNQPAEVQPEPQWPPEAPPEPQWPPRYSGLSRANTMSSIRTFLPRYEPNERTDSG